MNDYASTFYLVSDYVRTLNLASSRMSVSNVSNLKQEQTLFKRSVAGFARVLIISQI